MKDYIQPVIAGLALTLPFLDRLSPDQRSAILIGLCYFILYLLASFSARNSGTLADRFRSLTLLLNITLASGFLAGVLTGYFVNRDLLVPALALFVLVYLVENLRLPAGISWFTENIDSGILATTLSVESQGKSLFTALLAPLLGFLADRYGLGTALMATSGIMLLLLPLLRIPGKSQGGS